MPVRLSVQPSTKAKGAMSVGPLERQLTVAVVTHNSACLFWSGHAWFHINEEQLDDFFLESVPKRIRARLSFRPVWIKEGVRDISVPSTNHFNPIAAAERGWWENISGLYKLMLKMALLPQPEFPSLQRTIWYLRQANTLVLFIGKQFLCQPERPLVMRGYVFLRISCQQGRRQ